MSQVLTLQTIKKSPVGRVLRKIARPMLPGWVDAGRFIVQAPHLRGMLQKVARETARVETILNAGAGEGLYSSLLTEISNAKQILELDASFGLRHLSDPRQRLMTASLTALPLPGDSVDLILCSEVLEHIDADEQALSELARVLSGGGWLLISVPKPPAVYDPAHVREGYKPEDLRAMLEAHDLEVLDIQFCMHAIFRFFLRTYRQGYVPRFLVFTLGWLDRLAPLGEPMDVIMLARKTR
jgi:SAM-dependent methyltransferase